MKKFIILILILLLITNLMFSQSDNKEPKEPDNTIEKNGSVENINDKGKFKKLTKYDITRILFWTNYGVTGFTALTNTFAHLGYSLSISQEMSSLTNKIKDYEEDPGILPQLASYYPAVVFGFHFIGSGLAFIPAGGGIAYGVFLCGVGTAFSAIRATTYNPFNINIDHEMVDVSEEREKAWEIYNNMFDPTPYYVVGGLSILFGIGEIITTIFYIRERNKKRYPYMQKIFSISPTHFCITLKFKS